MADSIRDSIRIVTPNSIQYSIRTQTADSQVTYSMSTGNTRIQREFY